MKILSILLVALFISSCSTVRISISYGNPEQFKENQKNNSDKVWEKNKERVYNLTPIIHAPNVDSLNKAENKVLTVSDFEQK